MLYFFHVQTITKQPNDKKVDLTLCFLCFHSYPKIGKVYHNPSSGWAKNKPKKIKRLRIKHPIRPKDLGHIVADTVERITDSIKDYFYSAIDAKAKFALTLNYKRRSSENMLDFYRRFKSVYPCVVKSRKA